MLYKFSVFLSVYLSSLIWCLTLSESLFNPSFPFFYLSVFCINIPLSFCSLMYILSFASLPFDHRSLFEICTWTKHGHPFSITLGVLAKQHNSLNFHSLTFLFLLSFFFILPHRVSFFQKES